MHNTAVFMFKVHMRLAPQPVCDLLTSAPSRYGSKNCLTSHLYWPIQDEFVLGVIGLELSPSEDENGEVCAWF